MDPQATWEQLLDALTTGETDTAAELATPLLHWLDRGGFPPVICRKAQPCLSPELDRQLARAGCRYAKQIARPRHRRKQS
jgi:hypothetical protein